MVPALLISWGLLGPPSLLLAINGCGLRQASARAPSSGMDAPEPERHMQGDRAGPATAQEGHGSGSAATLVPLGAPQPPSGYQRLWPEAGLGQGPQQRHACPRAGTAHAGGQCMSCHCPGGACSGSAAELVPLGAPQPPSGWQRLRPGAGLGQGPQQRHACPRAGTAHAGGLSRSCHCPGGAWFRLC
jgi:hypothetical protein